VKQLIDNERWLHGPDFLSKDDGCWPVGPKVGFQTLDDDPELKQSAKLSDFVCHIAETTDADIIDRFIERHSSWYKLKLSVAWLLRLRAKLRKLPLKSGKITVSELRKAEMAIVMYVQHRVYGSEIEALKGAGRVVKSSSLIALNPKLGDDDILRVGGRLKNAPVSVSARHPVILPRRHHVVKLIAEHYHRIAGHSGRGHVLALSRQKYWIIHGKSTVRHYLKCMGCKRRTAKPMNQIMADLPMDRVTPDKPPFSFSGVDYFGPYHVKRGRSLCLRYGCLFSCLATRSVHIEIAHSLDTDSFLNAFFRFCSRRGNPELVRSDNGSNFVSGEKELKAAIAAWNQDKIEEALRQRDITWRFQCPTASSQSGVWERMIRSVRRILSALMTQQTLDDESLMTLMCQVEAIMNSRPITPVSDDPSDCEALTPNHLLLLRANGTLPPGVFVEKDLYSRRRWRQVQYLADVFWRRWTAEYLPLLQSRSKWQSEQVDLKPGDLVLMMDQTTPRNTWPLARVLEVRHGDDGHVRSAEIKTAKSTYVRPIQKLCLLEAALD